MRELWRDVAGYEGLYQVSNLGRVKSLARVRIHKNGLRYHIREKILTPTLDAYGYYVVGMVNHKGEHRAKTVHRLIATAFIPNPENKRCVDHINGIRSDNRIENLRWATHKENTQNMFRLGKQVNWANRCLTDEERWNFTHSQCRPIIRNDGKVYESVIAASQELGYKSSSMVSRCVRGLEKSVRGYSFRYMNNQELGEMTDMMSCSTKTETEGQ